MSAWQAQSASMTLEGTVLTSSFFHLFAQRCTSGTTAALEPISSWYISSNLPKFWAVFGEASQYLLSSPKDFGTSASDQRIYPPFPLLNDLNKVQIWLPEKNAQGYQKEIISEIWLLHLLGINSGASYFSHSFLAWSNILRKTFSQLLLFCRRISSTLSMNSITANIPNSFFCSSFETGRIIPEVCCTSKAAIKNVHFCTELSKAVALVATIGVREGILLGGRKKVALKITICPKNKQFALKLTCLV